MTLSRQYGARIGFRYAREAAQRARLIGVPPVRCHFAEGL